MKKPREPKELKTKNSFKVQIDNILSVDHISRLVVYVIKRDKKYLTPANRWSTSLDNASLFFVKKFAQQKIKEQVLKNCNIVKLISKRYSIWWEA